MSPTSWTQYPKTGVNPPQHSIIDMPPSAHDMGCHSESKLSVTSHVIELQTQPSLSLIIDIALNINVGLILDPTSWVYITHTLIIDINILQQDPEFESLMGYQ